MRWILLFAMTLGALGGLEALTLQEAEEIALANNPQVQASEQLIEMARQGRLDAISKWLPQLNIYTQGFKTQTTIPLLKITKPSAFLTELTLTQTLFSTQVLYQIGISSILIEQFEKLLEAAKNDILYQTRTLYFQVALDHKKVKTAEEHIDLLSYLSDRMQGKYNIGEATAYNVNQARVAVANVTDAYYKTVQMLKSHEDELSKTLGYDPVDSPFIFNQEDIDVLQIPELAEKVKAAESIFQEECILKSQFVAMQNRIMDKIFSKAEFSKWNGYADEHRPDILLSQTNVKLAEETVKLKRGEYWPTVSLLGNYGGGMTPYFFAPSTQFNNQNFQWAIGFSVNWTIFDGTGRERRVRKARAESRAIKFTAKKVAQAAHTDVREQLYSMQKAMAQYVTSAANYKLAQQTLEQAKSQLDIGFTTIYDYLISVDGLIRAKTAQDEGRFDLLSSYYALLHASGKESEK
ncbi:MAG TPA: TolC family protein [Rhabdochlamydiaceae bacterium]|nr:TolC family protein [Rhabdochlamydiaceae bacterium]